MPARRTVASVKILSELGVRLGSTRSALLTGSSILPAQLDDPHLEIDPDQELQVIHNLVRLHGKVPGLGLMAGAEYHLTTYGIWGYALITSPTFRQAVELGLRYLDLTFAFSKVELALGDGLASMILSVDHLPRQYVHLWPSATALPFRFCNHRLPIERLRLSKAHRG